MTMTNPPISTASILQALMSGKFAPLSKEDGLAFLDAGDDAVTWHASERYLVLISAHDDGVMLIEIYDNEDCDTIWQGDMLLKST
jgi:hypothetical protein